MAIESLAANLLEDLPTAPENLSRQVMIDPQWWNANQAPVLERWNAWVPD